MKKKTHEKQCCVDWLIILPFWWLVSPIALVNRIMVIKVLKESFLLILYFLYHEVHTSSRYLVH